MERDMRNECYECMHKREVPGSCHVACINPSVDVLRHGNAHGKKNGWFIYPMRFDPVWKESLCKNFEHINPAVSPAVSPETELAHTSQE